ASCEILFRLSDDLRAANGLRNRFRKCRRHDLLLMAFDLSGVLSDNNGLALYTLFGILIYARRHRRNSFELSGQTEFSPPSSGHDRQSERRGSKLSTRAYPPTAPSIL